MKSNKRLFIEKYFSGLSDDEERYCDEIETELLEAIEKDNPEGWISVEFGNEPEENQECLCIILLPDPEIELMQVLRYTWNGWLVMKQHGSPEPLTVGVVTSYMPLPKPPTIK